MQYVLLMLLFDLFIFQDCITRIFPLMRYLEEIVLIISLIAVFLMICTRPKRINILQKREWKVFLFLILLIIIGIISTFIYRNAFYLNEYVFKDIFALVKPFINYICFIILFKNVNKDILLNKISRKCKIYIHIIFIFSIINMFLPIGMDHDYRYGIKVFKFLYSHPTYLVFSMVILVCILVVENEKGNKKYILEGLFILLTTFRSKAFVFILGYVLINIFYNYSTKIKVRHIVFILLVGIMFTSNKIQDYFSHGLYAARPALYIIGLNIMSDYFPLGTGFSSFASSLSGENYSPVYAQYGINYVDGLSVENYSYMADVFWPYIYGQFGILGFIIYIYILGNIYISLKIRYSNNITKNKIIDLLFFYMMFASFAESVFIDTTGQFAFIVFAVFLGSDIPQNKKSLNVEEV